MIASYNELIHSTSNQGYFPLGIYSHVLEVYCQMFIIRLRPVSEKMFFCLITGGNDDGQIGRQQDVIQQAGQYYQETNCQAGWQTLNIVQRVNEEGKMKV